MVFKIFLLQLMDRMNEVREHIETMGVCKPNMNKNMHELENVISKKK